MKCFLILELVKDHVKHVSFRFLGLRGCVVRLRENQSSATVSKRMIEHRIGDVIINV